MANQWYYNRDGEKNGPIGDSDLRRMAADGVLKPDDQIWKEGMAEWRKAGAVKGLFPQSPPTSPPPVPLTITDAPSTEVVQEKKNRASFGESAKLAGQLAAKQAELAKVQQVSLPGLYAKIGNRAFADGSQRQRHEVLFGEIERLSNAIKELEKAGDNQPEPKTFSDKAMALGGKAATATKLKAAQLQRRHRYIALGKCVFDESHTPDNCKSEKASIEGLLIRSEELQLETTTVKELLSEQRREAGERGRSFFASTAVVMSLAVVCAPIGLFLLWKHPTWSKDTKKKWAGVSIACFLMFAIVGKMQEAATLKELAAANQLWDDGNNTDAIDEYRNLIGKPSVPSSEMPRLYCRVIEFDCENDNIESAKSLMERAYKSGIKLTFTNSMAKSLLSEVQSASDAMDEEEDAAEQPVQEAFSLANGRPSTAILLDYLVGEGFEFSTGDGMNAEGTQLAFLSKAPDGPSVVHMGSRKVLFADKEHPIVVMFVESEKDHKVTTVYFVTNMEKYGGGFDETLFRNTVDEVENLIPGCGIRAMIAKNSMRMSAGGSVESTAGKASLHINRLQNEIRIMIFIED